MIKLMQFLRTEILVNRYVYLDLWSIIHFLVGFSLYHFFKFEPIYAWIIIIGFEIVEPYFKHFKREHPTDTFWDIVIGMAGYYIASGLI